jgi:hypothetical protein
MSSWEAPWRRSSSRGPEARAYGSGMRVHVPFFDETILFSIHGVPPFQAQRSQCHPRCQDRHPPLHKTPPRGSRLLARRSPTGTSPHVCTMIPFSRRGVLKPLVRAFGYDRHAFSTQAASLGAREEGVRRRFFHAFRLPEGAVTFVLWGRGHRVPAIGEGAFRFPPSPATCLSKISWWYRSLLPEGY